MVRNAHPTNCIWLRFLNRERVLYKGAVQTAPDFSPRAMACIDLDGGVGSPPYPVQARNGKPRWRLSEGLFFAAKTGSRIPCGCTLLSLDCMEPKLEPKGFFRAHLIVLATQQDHDDHHGQPKHSREKTQPPWVGMG